MSVPARDRFERGRLGAMLRAAHLVEDQQPWIFEDEVAARLSGHETVSSLSAELLSMQGRLALTYPPALAQSLIREMRATVLLRSRYTEDQLAGAVKRGISQYIILGSRFDSFAYRNREPESTLRIFEVDHPTALQRKQNRLRELRLTPFSTVSYVPFNFDGRSLWRVLRNAGCNQEEPAFFSWLGAALHVPNDVILQTLEQIAYAAGTSEVVFDFPVDESRLDEERRQMVSIIKSFAVESGVSAMSGASPADLSDRLRDMGFGAIYTLSSTVADKCYFSNRTDELRCPRVTQVIKARIGESAPNGSASLCLSQ